MMCTMTVISNVFAFIGVLVAHKRGSELRTAPETLGSHLDSRRPPEEAKAVSDFSGLPSGGCLSGDGGEG